uniref:Uncharacterized protein n=1 Tax=Zonotrichia albicollis TaxID=44394 RepID=A0A8D2M119_ZONAL
SMKLKKKKKKVKLLFLAYKTWDLVYKQALKIMLQGKAKAAIPLSNTPAL